MPVKTTFDARAQDLLVKSRYPHHLIKKLGGYKYLGEQAPLFNGESSLIRLFLVRHLPNSWTELGGERKPLSD